MKNNSDQMSFFDLKQTNDGNRVPVLRCVAKDISTMNADEMFSGFSTLKATTFSAGSAGLAFVDKICEKFDYVQLAFGSDNALPAKVSELRAIQTGLIGEAVDKVAYPNLVRMLSKGSMTLTVAPNMVSHAKIYLMENEDGSKKRFILGSANFSESAFSGKQKEEILIFDSEDDPNFDEKYKSVEETFNNIVEQGASLNVDGIRNVVKDKSYFKKHPEKLPVISVLEQGGEVEINLEENAKRTAMNNRELVILNPELADPLEDATEKRFSGRKKKSKILKVSYTDVDKDAKRAKNEYKNEVRKIKIREEKPRKLVVLPLDHELMIDDEPVDLSAVSDESVTSDANILCRYFTSLQDAWQSSSSQETIRETASAFWRFLVWAFVSPFFPFLRYVTYIQTAAVGYGYPVFSLLNGASGSGKTSLAQLVMTMMNGGKNRVLSADDFTTTSTSNLMMRNSGILLCFDEIPSSRFKNHASGLIKNNLRGLNGEDNGQSYSCVALISNDIESITLDVQRRMVSFRSTASMSGDEGRKHGRDVASALKSATDSLFLKFIDRMFSEIDRMEKSIINSEMEEPDVFLSASKVLTNLIHEYATVDVPNCFQPFTFSDCMGDEAQGASAVERLSEELKINPECFTLLCGDGTVAFSPSRGSNAKTRFADLPKKFGTKFSSGGSMTFLLSSAEDAGLDFSQQKKAAVDKAVKHFVDRHNDFPHAFSRDGDTVVIHEILGNEALRNEYASLSYVTDVEFGDHEIKIPASSFEKLTGIRIRKRRLFWGRHNKDI